VLGPFASSTAMEAWRRRHEEGGRGEIRTSRVGVGTTVFFLLFGPFGERISQVSPFQFQFRKWTLTSAPSLLARRLHVSAPI
jgi:hypothetical protein